MPGVSLSLLRVCLAASTAQGETGSTFKGGAGEMRCEEWCSSAGGVLVWGAHLCACPKERPCRIGRDQTR
jgi:hypothetical protein